MKRALVIVGVCAAGCSASLEFADWTVPIQEGTPIIEYAHVPSEERTEWIEMELDLTMGNAEDGDGSIYRPFAFATDDTGRVYVADVGDHQVKVFDSEGKHVRNLGRKGQGPGEFIGPIGVTVAGSTLVVADETKLSLWTLDGEHIAAVATRSLAPSDLFGLTDGTVIVGYPALDESKGLQTSKFARWDQEAQELTVYPTLQIPALVFYPSRSSEGRTTVGTGMTWPSVAAGRDGDVFLTQSDEYQVLAFNAEGTPRWALRVAMPRPPLFRRDIERTLESVRRRFPEATERSIDWPPASYALDRIWIDGHGHLYVLLYAPAEPAAQEREVDVYSRDGNRLFAGRMTLPAGAWTRMSASSGDFMFYMGPDEETGEWTVSRYRLIEPFDREHP